MVSVLPVVPVRKYCAVYYLAHDSYHGMEEVVGSIPTRSTNPNQLLCQAGFLFDADSHRFLA